jgi:ribosomal protein S18 acetylase RimI-like enzyme
MTLLAPVRPAVVADAADLTRLRALLFDAMGSDTGDDTAPWRSATEQWFARHIADPGGRFAAFVVDDPELGVVSNAVGIVQHVAPSPRNAVGVRGEVFNVSTDPRRRRLGLARACVVPLLDWFARETDAKLVKLNATNVGAGLYTSLGFTEATFPELRLRLD